VTCVGFNHDSSLVVTGDMAGLIKVWSVDSRQEIWSYEVDDLEVCSYYFMTCIPGLLTILFESIGNTNTNTCFKKYCQ